MKALVIKHLNVRIDKPSVNASCEVYYEPGSRIELLEKVIGDSIDGNTTWYRIDPNHFVWSGGLAVESASPDISYKRFLEKAKNSNLFGWNIASLGINKIWEETYFGEGVKIAVLDSGIKADHKDLISSSKKTWCVLTNSSTTTDSFGHGTHCTGIINAQGDQLLGVAPAAEILVVKVYNQDGDLNIENTIKGIEWAAQNKVDIISMSLAFTDDFPGIDKLHETIKKYSGKIIFVAAAGNFGEVGEEINMYPAAFPECISVGALNVNGKRYYRSNRSNCLTLLAPGENINSTYTNPLYKELSDTSFATPLVSGVLALLISYVRKNDLPISFQNIIEILKNTCDKNGSDKYNSEYGFGVINPINALAKIKTNTVS